jgi:glycosyltransferase involved in cell wall biosynthesis
MQEVHSNPHFIFFSFAATGNGISGSDRIFIELARRWSINTKIDIFVYEDGYSMCQRQNLNHKNISFHVKSVGLFNSFGFFIRYIFRILFAIITALTFSVNSKEEVIVYSASEFWMDSLPAYILKLRFKNVRWVGTWYQTAPNPLRGFSQGKRKERYIASAFFYWFVQLPIKPLLRNFADIIIVNNESERSQFAKKNDQGKVIVLIGAVKLNEIDIWKNKHGNTQKIYDAVFQGRFHPQKGVVELMDIWKKVVEKKPNAKLVMIGDGPLMSEVKLKIINLDLEKNVSLLGYVFDGDRKYKTFQSSKLVVHPAFYDSGGMAAAEAMAFGLPCVGFDLEAYKSYYPHGMVKVPCGNMQLFALAINNLLGNKRELERIGQEAKKMICRSYSWDNRAEEIYSKIEKNICNNR